MAKTTQTEVSVADFIAAIGDPARRADCQTLAAMMQAATNEPPNTWGSNMVGFGAFHYRYASGHEGDTFVLGFASRKDTMTLYIAGSLENYAKLLQQLGKHKMGKGCLYIRSLNDVDQPTLALLFDAVVTSQTTNT